MAVQNRLNSNNTSRNSALLHENKVKSAKIAFGQKIKPSKMAICAAASRGEVFTFAFESRKNEVDTAPVNMDLSKITAHDPIDHTFVAKTQPIKAVQLNPDLSREQAKMKIQAAFLEHEGLRRADDTDEPFSISHYPEHQEYNEYLEFLENYMDKAFALRYDEEQEETLEEILTIYLQQYFIVNIDKLQGLLDFEDFFKFSAECEEWSNHFKNHLDYDSAQTIRLKIKIMELYPQI